MKKRESRQRHLLMGTRRFGMTDNIKDAEYTIITNEGDQTEMAADICSSQTGNEEAAPPDYIPSEAPEAGGADADDTASVS